MTTRRDFMKKAGVATAAAGTTAFAAPYVKLCAVCVVLPSCAEFS